jgi:PqqD family protein of HPr-rel-A system
MKWRAVSYTSDSLCCWSDEFVVFNNLSGDTHLLSAFAGQILLKLQQESLDVSSLIELFATTPQIDPERTELQIENILADLDSLGLIERI